MVVFNQKQETRKEHFTGEDMVRYKSVSNNGTRSVNEDCVGMFQRGEQYGFFLADGLGGHGKGEIASQTAVEQAILQFEAVGCADGTLEAVFENGQKEILNLQKKEQDLYSMKTTLTALLISETAVRWGHIGDSRIYWFRNGKMLGRTMDHSVPQMLVNIGEIQEEEIRNHPDRNRLLRVMGMEWDVPAYQLSEKMAVKNRQAFLLCSDGFWELIEERQMERLLKKSGSVEQWLDAMTAYVEENGKGKDMDNYSAIAVWISNK